MVNLNYEINSNTNAIIGLGKTSKVIEAEKEIEISMPPTDIIRYSCEYFGSTFEGRVKSAQKMLGMKYKLPVIIEETREIIFFPIKSYTNINVCWISLNNITHYEEYENKSKIYFRTGQPQIMDISLESLENQILRASKLLLILKSRKTTKF